MMRRVFSVALVACVAALGLAQNANAGVTIDVLFQDAAIPSGITISPGDAGTGCAFGGYASGSVASGYCMDVILTSTFDMIFVGASVTYDSDNGLAVGAIYEWKGPITSWSRGSPTGWCSPLGGVVDDGSSIQAFDCGVPPPNNPPTVAAGTYRIGTIVWDTSGTFAGGDGQETVAAWINDLFDYVGAIINGSIVGLDSSQISVGTHILTIIPEPGTASLLGLGLVGLILAGRRSRA